MLTLRKGETRKRDKVLRHLIDIQYERNDYDFTRGTFRVRGDTLEVYPAAYEIAIRDRVLGRRDRAHHRDRPADRRGAGRAHRDRHLSRPSTSSPREEKLQAAPSTTSRTSWRSAVASSSDRTRCWRPRACGSAPTSTWRCCARPAICSGVENYSRHLSRRAAGQPPWTLLDYFPDDYLLFVDESHMTLPQVRGMYRGDQARKDDAGRVRLPPALGARQPPADLRRVRASTSTRSVYVSATPGPYEQEHSEQIVEQVIRPTGLIDPSIEVKPTKGQIDDLLEQIASAVAPRRARPGDDADQADGRGPGRLPRARWASRSTTCTRRSRRSSGSTSCATCAWASTTWSSASTCCARAWTCPRSRWSRILDADKEGYLRSESALIQTIGRAARHVDGQRHHVRRHGDRLDAAAPSTRPTAGARSRWRTTRSTASRRAASRRRSATSPTGCAAVAESRRPYDVGNGHGDARKERSRG